MDPANDPFDPSATRIDFNPTSPAAAEEMFALVYEELRRLAEGQLAREPSGLTIQATALVHEAYLKLSGDGQTWAGRRQFFAAAAEAMRRILVDHARRRRAAKRGGSRTRVVTDLSLLPEVRPDEEVLALADALSEFETKDARAAELVKLRYFAGLTLDEAAAVVDVARSTAARDWAYAKAWLRRRLADTANETPLPAPEDPSGDIMPDGAS